MICMWDIGLNLMIFMSIPDHDSNKPPILLEDFELFKTLINKNRKRKYNIDMK